jgi:hypothetical protein
MNTTTSTLTLANRWDHLLARFAIKRSAHRVEPGLYAIGSPTPAAPVFVSANYTLSFDALRSALNGISAYILVLNTDGVNVWCAAGKGTFGTDELVKRIEATGLRDKVEHRVVILPQLGAPGVAAHEVKKRTTFKVEYGPVRAADLPEYLKNHVATTEMRRVRYTLRDRVAVIPVEIVGALAPMFIAAALLYFIGGWVSSLAVIAAVLAGSAIFPILLPWLPTHDFSTKGFLLGVLVALPFVVLSLQENSDAAWWYRAGRALAPLLIWPSVTAFLALNFTGSSTFTSRSGVQREIYAYVPAMAWMFAGGVALMLGLPIIRALGG